MCVCGVGVTSLHKVGKNFFAEWCYSVNVRKVVRDMSGETEICLVEVESMFCML